jgi:hypothetical protein
MPESMCISCYHSDIVGIGNVLMAESIRPYYIAMIAADAHGFRHQRKDPYQISELEIGLFNLVDV